MMVPVLFMVLLLVSWSHATYPDESYQLSDNSDSGYLYPEDYTDDSEYEVRKRTNNNFLRFGRSGSDYDEYAEDFARPTRSGKIDKNDHFIRFGRAKQDFLRFGRDSHRVQRANHLRFGRSTGEADDDKVRNKRDTYSEEAKRDKSGYLRFGRRANSNFMRFGRNNEMAPAPSTPDYETLNRQASVLLSKIKQHPNSQIYNLLMVLLDNVRRNNVVL